MIELSIFQVVFLIGFSFLFGTLVTYIAMKPDK